MNYRKNTFTLLVVGALLTGCGGGGTDISGGSSGSSTGSTTSGSTGTGSTVTAGAPVSIVASTLTTKYIALKGYSSATTLPSSAPVTFTVYDADNIAVPNQVVSFAFANTSMADVGFTLSKSSATTNSSGQVTVNVNSGYKSTAVNVVATLNSDSSIKVISSSIQSGTTLTSSKNGLSISMDKNTLAADYDGDTASVTVSLKDRYNAALPDGTVVQFVTSLGRLSTAGGSCITTNSTCTLSLYTQNSEVGSGYLVAYTPGEEYFDDLNEDGLLNLDEEFDNATPLFTDMETINVAAVQADGNLDSVSAGDGIYEGYVCAPEILSNPNYCKQSTVQVWDEYPINFVAMRSANINLEHWDATNSKWVAVSDSNSIDVSTDQYFRVIGYYNNSGKLLPLAAGSTVTVTKDSATGGSIVTASKPLGYSAVSAYSVFQTLYSSYISSDSTQSISGGTYPTGLTEPFYYYFKVLAEDTAAATPNKPMTVSFAYTPTDGDTINISESTNLYDTNP